MAICDPSSLLSANPFLRLDPGLVQAVELALLQSWAGNTETPSQLLAKASDSGFIGLDPGLADAVEAQLLCNIRNT